MLVINLFWGIRYFFMRKIINLLLPATLLFSVFACNSNSESRLLKFNLEKGKSYSYEVVMDLDQEVMNQKNRIGFVAGYTINVVDDNGTLKTLDVVYKDFKMNMNVMGQQINIDAAKKPDTLSLESLKENPMQVLTNAFSGIIGKKFTMKVTAAGKIEEITGFEEMIRGMVENMTIDDKMRNAVSASLKDQFNSEKIKEMFAPMFSVYPNKEIEIGDKWSNSYVMSSQATRINSNFKAKSFQGENVVIEVKSKIVPEGETNNPAFSGVKMSGTHSGTMTVNTRSGLVVDGEINQNIETSGNLKMKMISKTKMRGKEGS